MEQIEFSFVAGENKNWYNHFGRQFDNILQSLT